MLERLPPPAFLLLFHRQAACLLFKPGRVVPLPRDALAAVQFQDPSGHVVQEVTVVRHRDHRPLVLAQVRFQPLDTLGVEVVCRLVQQEDVRLLQQQAAQGHPAAFSAGEVADQGVVGRAAQRVHRPLELGVDVPAAQVVDFLRQFALALDQRVHLVVVHRLEELHRDVVVLLQGVHHILHPFLDDFQDRLVRVHLRLLLQVADAVARRPDHFAAEGRLHAGDDLQEGGFSGTVQADDADLGPVEEG